MASGEHFRQIDDEASELLDHRKVNGVGVGLLVLAIPERDAFPVTRRVAPVTNAPRFNATIGAVAKRLVGNALAFGLQRKHCLSELAVSFKSALAIISLQVGHSPVSPLKW